MKYGRTESLLPPHADDKREIYAPRTTHDDRKHVKCTRDLRYKTHIAKVVTSRHIVYHNLFNSIYEAAQSVRCRSVRRGYRWPPFEKSNCNNLDRKRDCTTPSSSSTNDTLRLGINN